MVRCLVDFGWLKVYISEQMLRFYHTQFYFQLIRLLEILGVRVIYSARQPRLWNSSRFHEGL
jgi:hypothetical protein